MKGLIKVLKQEMMVLQHSSETKSLLSGAKPGLFEGGFQQQVLSQGSEGKALAAEKLSIFYRIIIHQIALYYANIYINYNLKYNVLRVKLKYIEVCETPVETVKDMETQLCRHFELLIIALQGTINKSTDIYKWNDLQVKI